MIFSANPAPKSNTFLVRGQSVTLHKLEGDDQAHFAKMLLVAAAASVRGVRDARTGKGPLLRRALEQIFFSLQDAAGRALNNLQLAKQLSPAEHRAIVERQNQLQNWQTGEKLHSEPIQPASTALFVGGKAVQLKAMSGAELADWAETQVLCAQEQIVAQQLAKRKRNKELRATAEQLVRAELDLVARVVPDGLADQADRRQVILAQDRLNLMDELTEILEIYAARAYLKVGL